MAMILYNIIATSINGETSVIINATMTIKLIELNKKNNYKSIFNVFAGQYIRAIYQGNISGQYIRAIYQGNISGQYIVIPGMLLRTDVIISPSKPS